MRTESLITASTNRFFNTAQIIDRLEESYSNPRAGLGTSIKPSASAKQGVTLQTLAFVHKIAVMLLPTIVMPSTVQLMLGESSTNGRVSRPKAPGRRISVIRPMEDYHCLKQHAYEIDQTTPYGRDSDISAAADNADALMARMLTQP